MKVKNVKMVSHWSFTNQHILSQTAEIIAPGNILHGQTMIIETSTPKRKNGEFGKATILYYLPDKNSPTFKTQEEFKQHYKII